MEGDIHKKDTDNKKGNTPPFSKWTEEVHFLFHEGNTDSTTNKHQQEKKPLKYPWLKEHGIELLLAFATFLLYWEATNQSEISNKAAKAAILAAQATRAAVSIDSTMSVKSDSNTRFNQLVAQMDERAYIAAPTVTLDFGGNIVGEGAVNGKVIGKDINGKYTAGLGLTNPTVEIKYVFKNVGKTPAYQVRSIQGSVLSPHTPKMDSLIFLEKQIIEVTKTSLGATEERVVLSGRIKINLPDMSNIVDSKKNIYVFGYIGYDDVFNTHHTMRFCYLYDIITDQCVPVGNYNDAD